MVKTKQLFQSTVLVILFFGLGKITGLFRARLVGQVFGTGAEYDAFTAANQLPEVFYILIAGGALAAAFIPVYTNTLTNENSKQAAQLANTVLTLVIMILGVICLVGAFFAPWLTRTLLVPSYSPEQQQLTAELMRIILIQTTIFGVSGVLTAILNGNQHFALPALAPLALDVGYVAGLYLFVPTLGIHGLAWGTVLGSVLHVLIQLPALVKYRIGYTPMLALKMSGVREIIRLMGPRIVTLGAIQMADLFIISLASALPEGSTSAYFYGFTLMQLPETLFGTAIALVMFPTMSELFNAGDVKGMKETAVSALGIIWTLTIPCAAGLVLLGQPAIALVLGGGAFSAESVRLVYSVLIAFSIRLVAEATLEIVARLFYARHNTRTPMFVYLIWLAVHAVFAYLLVDDLGVVGLALSSTIAFTTLSTILFVLNWRELDGLGGLALGKSAGRAVMGTVGLTAVVLVLRSVIDSPMLFLAVGTGAGAIVYAVIHLLLGGSELPQLIRLVRQR